MQNRPKFTPLDLGLTTKLRMIAAQYQRQAEGQTKSALVYLRAPRHDSGALHDQSITCKTAADLLGAQLVAEYSDIGSGHATERSGLGRLLSHVHTAPQVDYVIVHRLDRLTRSTQHFLVIADVLAGNGVSLVTAS